MTPCVAIDFDGTWTWDDETMESIVDLLAAKKVVVICATSRKDTQDNRLEFARTLPPNMPIVFCGGEYKLSAVRARGYDPIFVVDDQPESWRGAMPMWMVRLRGALKWLTIWRR